MADALLQKKGVPPAKAASTALLAVAIIGAIAYRLYDVSIDMEVHFHVFHPSADHSEIAKHPGRLLFLIAQFPLFTILGLFLLIPLGPYIAEHEAFQSLNPLFPHHYLKLCQRVYSAWGRASGGKLAGKDL